MNMLELVVGIALGINLAAIGLLIQLVVVGTVIKLIGGKKKND